MENTIQKVVRCVVNATDILVLICRKHFCVADTQPAQNVARVNVNKTGGDSLWELSDGDILQPKDGKTFTIKKAYEVDVADGSTDKYLNEQGDFTTINTSPIGVSGSELYMSVQDSDVAGYKLLSNAIDTSETEITITASSADGIVWGNKYLTP